MTSIRSIAVVLAALALSSGAARAADLVGAFDKDCLQTHGDDKAALALADAAGWTKSDGKPPTANPNFKLDTYGMRTTGTGPDAVMLVAGAGSMPMAGRTAPAKFCMLAGDLGDDGAARVGSTLGMAPFMTMNMPGAENARMNMYMFHEGPGGRVALTPAEMGAMNKAGEGQTPPVSMIMTMDAAAHKGMLMYILINP